MKKVPNGVVFALASEPLDHGVVGLSRVLESPGIRKGSEELHRRRDVPELAQPPQHLGLSEERFGRVGSRGFMVIRSGVRVEDKGYQWFVGFEDQRTAFFQVHLQRRGFVSELNDEKVH